METSRTGRQGARDKHKLLVADVAKKIDPRAAKAAAPTAVPTFGDIADAHVQTHEATWRNAKHRYQWRQTLTQYCGPIRDMPVNQIATADVLAVLKPLWDRAPETASRLRGRIQTGEIVLELDDGKNVHLRQGDCVVQNGTRHRWANPLSEPCLMAFVLIGGQREA
jgi:hypothetical protein